jgi:hypothetical protein
MTVVDVLVALARVADGRPDLSLENRLESAGWVKGEAGSAGLHRQWWIGEIVGAQFGRGMSAFFEVTVEMAGPDIDDLDSEEDLAKDSERRFAESVSAAAVEVGDPAFVGSYGEDGFPEDLDAVSTAQWPRPAGVIAVHLKHEDQGLPFRITVTVS